MTQTTRASKLVAPCVCLAAVVILAYLAHRSAHPDGNVTDEPPPSILCETTDPSKSPTIHLGRQCTEYTCIEQRYMYFKPVTEPKPPTTNELGVVELTQPNKFDTAYVARSMYSTNRAQEFNKRVSDAHQVVPQTITIDINIPTTRNPVWWHKLANDHEHVVDGHAHEKQFQDLFVNDHVRTEKIGPEQFSLTLEDFNGEYKLDEPSAVTGVASCHSHHTWTKEYVEASAKNAMKPDPPWNPLPQSVQCTIYAAHAEPDFVQGVRKLVNDDETPLQCSDPPADSEDGTDCKQKYRTNPQFRNQKNGENYLFYGPKGPLEMADQNEHTTVNTWIVQCEFFDSNAQSEPVKCNDKPVVENPLQFYLAGGFNLALRTYPQDSRFAVKSWGDSRWFAVIGSGNANFGRHPIQYDGAFIGTPDPEFGWTEFEEGTNYQKSDVVTRRVWEIPGLTINPA
jgi:hypothetical protein